MSKTTEEFCQCLVLYVNTTLNNINNIVITEKYILAKSLWILILTYSVDFENRRIVHINVVYHNMYNVSCFGQLKVPTGVYITIIFLNVHIVWPPSKYLYMQPSSSHTLMIVSMLFLLLLSYSLLIHYPR